MGRVSRNVDRSPQRGVAGQVETPDNRKEMGMTGISCQDEFDVSRKKCWDPRVRGEAVLENGKFRRQPPVDLGKGAEWVGGNAGTSRNRKGGEPQSQGTSTSDKHSVSSRWSSAFTISKT